MKKRLKLLPNGNHRKEMVSYYYALADISVVGKNYAKALIENRDQDTYFGVNLSLACHTTWIVLCFVPFRFKKS